MYFVAGEGSVGIRWMCMISDWWCTLLQGWGLYSEALGEEMGVYEGSDTLWVLWSFSVNPYCWVLWDLLGICCCLCFCSTPKPGGSPLVRIWVCVCHTFPMYIQRHAKGVPFVIQSPARIFRVLEKLRRNSQIFLQGSGRRNKGFTYEFGHFMSSSPKLNLLCRPEKVRGEWEYSWLTEFVILQRTPNRIAKSARNACDANPAHVNSWKILTMQHRVLLRTLFYFLVLYWESVDSEVRYPHVET